MDETTLKKIIGDLYCEIYRAQEIIQSQQKALASQKQEIDRMNQENEELRISSK